MRTAEEKLRGFLIALGNLGAIKLMDDAILDTLRRGYTEAALIAGIHPPRVKAKDRSDYCRGRNDAARDVIAARDKLKAK